MPLYASTFPAGFGEVIKSAVHEALPDAAIDRIDESIVLYRSDAKREKICALRFFQNTFLVLSLTEINEGSAEDQLKSLIGSVRSDEQLDHSISSSVSQKNKGYTVLASVENRLTSIPVFALQKLEKRLSSVGNFQVHRQKPDSAFWLMVRREGYGFLGIRLTHRNEKDHARAQGELRPEIAHLLCLLSHPQPDDIFLDPCCGSGAIPLERAKSVPYARIITGDDDPNAVKALTQKSASLKNFSVHKMDATLLTGIKDGTISTIVTDPPWGLFQKIDVTAFLQGFLNACHRVLKIGGLLVVLTGAKDLFDHAVDAMPATWEKMSVHHVLVSGKKAGVYVLRRR